MKKSGRSLLAMTMAVVMGAATIGSMVPANGITAEAAGIRLSKSSLNMKVGQSKQLVVKGTKKAVKWSVSNGKIAKVTKKGKVTAKKVGNAKVYAKVKGKKLTCKIKVTAKDKPKVTIGPTMSATPTAAPVSTAQGNTNNTSSGSGSGHYPKATSIPKTTTGASIAPQATNQAMETEIPNGTGKPNRTEEPSKTNQPERTGLPEETEKPDVTNAPKETKNPEETESPDNTKMPKETNTPEETEKPDNTKEPEETDVPEETENPDATETPEETGAPEATEKPEETSAPDVPQGKVEEIKVGETKSTTVNGIKFTCTARQDMLIVKMENTTKVSKAVSGKVSLLNSKGEVLNEDMNLYKTEISNLGAGQIYYNCVYNFESGFDVASYTIHDFEVTEIDPYWVNCLKDIKVTPEQGTDVESGKLTLEYTGDVAEVAEKCIYVYGSVVYYDSDDNIVDIMNIFENIEISSENSQTSFEIFSMSNDSVRYEVILSGAEYSDFDQSLDL